MIAADDRAASSPAAIPGMVLALLFFHLLGLPWLTFGLVGDQGETTLETRPAALNRT
jgi:hypothetical protein